MTRRYALLGICLGLGATGLPAADLVVQGSNSPYIFSGGTASYDNIYVGQINNGILNQIAGTLNVTSGQLFLGYSGAITGTYLLSGGTLNTVSTDVGDYGTGVFTLSATGVHNVTGTSGTAAGSLDLGVYAGSNGTYNLDGGTLTAGYVRGGAGTSTFNFNGGTLTAGADATDFFQNLTHAYVRNGGALINSGAYSVTIAQDLVTGPSGNGTDGGLTKSGSGTLTLTGNNTYTGSTTINAGTLQIGNGGTAGTLGTSTGPIINNGTLAFNRGDNISVGNIILGGGALTKLGAGTLTLTGTNTYAGLTTIVDGTLQIGNGGTTGTLGTNTVSVLNSAILAFNRGDNFSVDNVITGGGGLIKSGSGTLTLTGNSTYAGTTTINAGTLQVGNGGTTGTLGTGTGPIINNGTLVFNRGNDVTVAKVISGMGSVTQAGNGTLTFTKASTYTGPTTVSAGTLTVGTGGSLGDTTITVGAGATFNVTGRGVLTGDNGDLLVNGTATLTSSAALNRGRVSVGDAANSVGSLTQSAGSLVAYPNRGFYVGNGAGSSGSYTLSGTGSLTAGDTYIGSVGTGSVTQTGGSFTAYGDLYLGNNSGSSGSYALSGTGSLSTGGAYIGFGGTGNFTQSGGSFTTNASALTIGASPGNSTYTLSGTGSLSTGPVFIGSGGTGTFTQTGGTFTAIGDPLRIGYGAASTGTFNLSGTGKVSVGAVYLGSAGGTGTLNISGGTFTTNGGGVRLSGDGSSTGTVNLSGTGSLSTGTVSIGQDGTGTINQTGGTFTTNGNPLIFYSSPQGANTVSATYTLGGGTLVVSNVEGRTDSSPTPSPTYFNFNGGTLQPSDDSATFFQGVTTANVQMGGAIFDTGAYSISVAQDLLHDTTAGAGGTDGGLTKLGTGTLTLAGNNTYTGGTKISAGTLLVNNLAASGSATGTGAVTVSNAGTLLGGTGFVGGAVTVNGGAGVLGGNGTTADGTLTLQGALTLNPGSIVELVLGTNLTHSSLARTGTGTWTFADGQTFILLSDGTLTTGLYDNVITGLAADPGGESSWKISGTQYQGSFVYDGLGNIDLNVTAVPEPATWLAGALLVGGAGWTMRRRLASW